MTPIAEAKSSDEKSAKRGGTGIYKERNPRQETWCVYFYYVTDRNGYDEVKAYRFYSRTKITNIKNKITDLLKNVFDQTQTPRQYGSRFRSFPWRRYSYVVIALDSENVKFRHCNALEVKHRASKSNHSFFDALDYTQQFNVGGVDRDVSIVYFINHMLARDGREIGENKKEIFDFYWNLVKRRRRPFLPPDSGGTNQGGPVPPPYR